MCTIDENDQQLLLHTVIIMASHQVIDTWHKMAVSEGVSQGYVRQGIFASVWVKLWKCCQRIFVLCSNFKPQRQTLTSSRSATAVGNSSSWQANVLGMGNLHLSELWSEITALRCEYIVFLIAAHLRAHSMTIATNSDHLRSSACFRRPFCYFLPYTSVYVPRILAISKLRCAICRFASQNRFI